MAKNVIVRTVCDRCAADGQADVEASESVSFTYDGYAYALDLCEPHADDFHNTVQGMISWSTDRSPVTATRRRTAPTNAAPVSNSGRQPARRDKEQIAAIREWANANGYEVSSRGRIPGEVEAAYNASR